ncbi:MAG: hypothetical protein ACE363_14715 [Alphaproteobacteria bacterium]
MGETDHTSFAEILDAALAVPETDSSPAGPDGKPCLDQPEKAADR